MKKQRQAIILGDTIGDPACNIGLRADFFESLVLHPLWNLHEHRMVPWFIVNWGLEKHRKLLIKDLYVEDGQMSRAEYAADMNRRGYHLTHVPPECR